MEPRKFVGPDLPRVLHAVRIAFGADAIVIATHGPAETGNANYEVTAAPPGASIRVASTMRPAAARTDGPHVIALVGPAGSGKTTTAIKLALHADAFGGRRVGLLTLDTYRAAGVDQLAVFAEIADIPLEVAWDANEAVQAMARLESCDVVVIDTPGRGMRGTTGNEWRASLAAARADEVHLVVPAGLRVDVAVSMRDACRWCRTTHALITRIDEVPDRSGLRELFDALGLPVRWCANGQEVPHDLFASTFAPALAHTSGVAV
jgi:flagellar biosynthesis protein FlhF